MSAAQSRKHFDVRQAEGPIGESIAIAWLIRETVEYRGRAAGGRQEAVHFLACLVRDRAKQLDAMVAAALHD